MAKLGNLGGVWTAMITPFDKEGKIDWRNLQQHIDFQIGEGINGILVAGTTGESPALTWEEHNEIVARMIALVGSRCKTMAGTGSNSTDEAVAATEEAAAAGVEAVLLVDCYYNCPSSLELRKEYYAYIASRFPQVDIVPYIIPGRTGTALSPEDLAILAAEYPNINAVKEASGDLERMIRVRELVGREFSILSGDDGLIYEMIARPGIAASGAISVMANIVPGAIVEMVEAMIAGNVKRGEELHNTLRPLFEIVTIEIEEEREISGKKLVVTDKFRNPLPLKTLMNGLGMNAGPTRRPLGKMSARAVDVVRKRAKLLWETNSEILKPIEDAYGVKIEERLEKDKYWDKLSYQTKEG